MTVLSRDKKVFRMAHATCNPHKVNSAMITNTGNTNGPTAPTASANVDRVYLIAISEKPVLGRIVAVVSEMVANAVIITNAEIEIIHPSAGLRWAPGDMAIMCSTPTAT